MKRVIWIGIVAAALAVGCGNKDAGEPSAAPADPAPAVVGDPAADMPTPTDAAVAAVPDDQVPTAEDFEDEARDAITEDNLEKELSEIEKEIGD